MRFEKAPRPDDDEADGIDEAEVGKEVNPAPDQQGTEEQGAGEAWEEKYAADLRATHTAAEGEELTGRQLYEQHGLLPITEADNSESGEASRKTTAEAPAGEEQMSEREYEQPGLTPISTTENAPVLVQQEDPSLSSVTLSYLSRIRGYAYEPAAYAAEGLYFTAARKAAMAYVKVNLITMGGVMDVMGRSMYKLGGVVGGVTSKLDAVSQQSLRSIANRYNRPGENSNSIRIAYGEAFELVGYALHKIGRTIAR